MVTKIGRIRKISVSIPKNKQEGIIARIRSEFGSDFKVTRRGDKVTLEGEFHNWKKRERVLFILSGGKIGENV